MLIILSSQSAVKIQAVKEACAALNIEAEVIGVKAASGVPEQPMNVETAQGAWNRIMSARKINPDGNLYLSIENGIFEKDGGYYDKAVIAAQTSKGVKFTAFSDGVQFPAACVEEARQRGFDKVTVGKVMAEKGIVAQHDDPHLTLTGKSRAEFLRETVTRVLKTIFHAQIARNPSPGAVL